jgi:hypothetical protein
MAEVGSWPSIRRHGLLSAESLLDLFEITGQRRTEILTRRRPTLVTIVHPKHGRAVIRDQKALSEEKLAGCLLDGLTPAVWLQMLNSKVFFWVDPKRLAGLRNARAYREGRQLVLTLDTRELLGAYADRVILSDRNTGTTSPIAHPRGRGTFLPLREDDRRRTVELVIERGVRDISKFVASAVEIGGAEEEAVLYERGLTRP